MSTPRTPDVPSIEVETPIRLGQFLKLASLVDSGADGADLIAAGDVRVDGEEETRRGRQLQGGEVIEVSGPGGTRAARVASVAD